MQTIAAALTAAALLTAVAATALAAAHEPDATTASAGPDGASPQATTAAGCPAEDAVPSGDGRAARAALDCLIDRERTRRDRDRLRRRESLDEAAARHAADLVRRGYFSHVSLGGSTVGDRARAAGYARRSVRWRVGEVLAWGTGSLGTPEATVQAWMRSSGHRTVLLDGGYEDFGIGVSGGVPRDAALPGATFVVLFGRTDS